MDLLLHLVQQLELLGYAAWSLSGQTPWQIQELRPPLVREDVTFGVQRKGILGQGGVHAVLEHGADLGEGHARARELPLVPQVSGRDADRRQGAVVEESG